MKARNFMLCLGNFKHLNTLVFRNKSDDDLYLYSRLKRVFSTQYPFEFIYGGRKFQMNIV